MAFELVYTSVPKGLKPGSYGFCTVACSKELPESVVSTLEKISGYRRVSQSNAPGANPVVYSHMLLSAQGGSRRVVSRISDAGVDYTSRDNKIACHYVLEQRDLCKAGPAALVAQPGLFAERWTEGPRQFEGSITFPPTPEIAPTCDEWSKVLGDPGWAGALAATTYSARAALLIVEPSCNVLRLFQEAGVLRTIEAKDSSYCDEGMGEFLERVSGGNSELLRWRRALEEDLGIRPMKEYDGRPLYKIVFMCEKAEQLAPAIQALEQEFYFLVQDLEAAGCLNGELINRKFDKGSGVKCMAQALGIPLEDTVGFGDSMNDLEMIQTVGFSVCMANGSPTLKKFSDLVCPSVEEEGLAWAFRELGLVESTKKSG